MPKLAEQADKELRDLLRERGLRVTSQRLVIHRVLRERSDHQSAERVHGEVAEALPGVSLPTVYSTLELFEQLGLVRRVSAGGAVLFDARTEDHHHTVCGQCGRVEDLDVSLDTGAALDVAAAAGFAPRRADVLVTGVCRLCQAAPEPAA